MQLKELPDSEIKRIYGGDINSPIINALNKSVEIIYNLGVELGSGLRRLFTGDYCPIN